METATSSPLSTQSRKNIENSGSTTIIPHMNPSLTTPLTVSTMVNHSNSKEFMKLTPVRIRDFGSPLKNVSTNHRFLDSENGGHSTVDNMYKENFNLISKELEKLLENLNIIYQNIGYSNTEIINKEKLIFTTISDSIKHFFEQADDELKRLSTENGIEQDILNNILETINDPSGIKTIPDLYIRNAILLQESKTVPQSPKKPLSLLSKKAALDTAKKFVLGNFLPQLHSFLKSLITLKKLMQCVQEDLPGLTELDTDAITAFPELDILTTYLAQVENTKDDIGLSMKFIRDNKKDILRGSAFKIINQESVMHMDEVIKIYEREYENRFKSILMKKATILSISEQLEIPLLTVIDKNFEQDLRLYREEKSSTSELSKFYPVDRERICKIDTALKKMEEIYSERTNKKKLLMEQCQKLWRKLRISQEYIKAFAHSNSSLSIETLDKYSTELTRLETMKKKLIKKLISDSWDKIRELWDTLQYSDTSRSKFLIVFEELRRNATTLQEDELLLETCESELKRLENKLVLYKPILKLISDFQSLQQDQQFLEDSSKDSSRLLSRNSHKILLTEEKMRKRITRHFPRVINDLRVKLEEAEGLFDQPFMYKGTSLSEAIEIQQQEIEAKYPRCRVRMQRPKKGMSATSKENKVVKTTFKITQNSIRVPVDLDFNAVNITHKTPSKTTTKQIPKSGSSREALPTRHMKGTTRLSSPKRRHTKLPPPTIVSKNSKGNLERPILKRDQSSNISSPPMPNHIQNDCPVRPRQLFPISLNKVTTRGSHIPQLTKEKAMELAKRSASSTGKENTRIAERKSSSEDYAQKVSSPYKESENSVYKLSMSPEGKFQLNIQQKDIESAFDDTSMMEDENDKDFITWKNEQVSKLNGLSFTDI
ncbi:ase1p [Saccharomyces arboricola H-6]|uniref:Ase1p n=1 Tax=Saccharomyces arboricola (strain H-6 / AS 2.3317 / CBS 10644) TaxID=1160507 RepID=J8PZB2_SACAR|nr:ase1p [Saccharomyces arboricola H-6]